MIFVLKKEIVDIIFFNSTFIYKMNFDVEFKS